MKEQEKSTHFLRANNVIQADKTAFSEGCKELVLQDFAEVFSEYFDLKSSPNMEVVKTGDEYAVTLCFTADRIKKFNVLK